MTFCELRTLLLPEQADILVQLVYHHIKFLSSFAVCLLRVMI